MTAKGGVLFGTTDEGGAAGAGTAFSLDPKTQRANFVYAFKGTPDGQNPGGDLVLHDGNFYGVTVRGGDTNNGTVFELTREGVEKVLYSFKGGADGGVPRTLMLDGGALYGTASAGGGGACTNYQCGTIFKFDLKSGAKTTIHGFTGGADGWGPSGALISFGGALYGTTEAGGSDIAACQRLFQDATGCGTVFKLTE